MRTSTQVSKILVRAPNWIGDQVLAYPFFHYLRATYPRAKITVASMPWVAAIQYRNLVDEVVVMPKSASGAFLQKAKTLRLISAELKQLGPWDLGISLPNSFSAAWLLMAAGCKRRMGYRGDWRWWLLNDVRTARKDFIDHRADSYLRLLPKGRFGEGSKIMADLFWGAPPENDLDPGIPGVVAEFDAAKAWSGAKTEGALEPPPGEYWVLAPGSAAAARRWPLERFVALIELIHRETGLQVVLAGGAGEKEAGAMLEKLPHVVNRIGQGAVNQYWKLFKNARFTIANDSGLAHVAALCGSRAHVIWGAGDPRRTAPLGPGKVTLTINPVECWPCEKNLCMHEGAKNIFCLKGIQPEQVWNDLKRGSQRKITGGENAGTI